MVRRQAMRQYRRPVLRRTIARMALEAIVRIDQRQPLHNPIAQHLGDDRGRGNRQAQPVPPTKLVAG